MTDFAFGIELCCTSTPSPSKQKNISFSYILQNQGLSHFGYFHVRPSVLSSSKNSYRIKANESGANFSADVDTNNYINIVLACTNSLASMMK